MSKRRGPALYELVGHKPEGAAEDAQKQAAAREAAARQLAAEAAASTPRDVHEEDRVLGLSPGRVVRVPIGTVFVVVFVLLAAAGGAYILGYTMGERNAERRLVHDDRQMPDAGSDGGSGAAAGAIIDPLGSPRQGSSPDEVTGDRQQNGAPAPEGAERAQLLPNGLTRGQAEASPALWVVENAPADDPRRVGLNYLDLAYITRSEAERMGQFLVAQGYPVMIGPTAPDATGPVQVLLLRGFTAEQLRAGEGDQLKQRMLVLGQRYSDRRGGVVDFVSISYRLYRGPKR